MRDGMQDTNRSSPELDLIEQYGEVPCYHNAYHANCGSCQRRFGVKQTQATNDSPSGRPHSGADSTLERSTNDSKATSDTFCTANVGTASSAGYIACAADQSAPLHNPHDVEHFQHEYRSDYPHRTKATFAETQRLEATCPICIPDRHYTDIEAHLRGYHPGAMAGSGNWIERWLSQQREIARLQKPLTRSALAHGYHVLHDEFEKQDLLTAFECAVIAMGVKVERG